MIFKITAEIFIISLCFNSIVASHDKDDRLECQNGDTQPLAGECEWYRICLNGKYGARRCPTNGVGLRQMFNPIASKCTDRVALSIKNKCQSYKECLVIDTVSPFGKWAEKICPYGLHFDQESQQCIEPRPDIIKNNFKKYSHCGKILKCSKLKKKKS
jgi:hypothetical protein